MTFYPEVCEKMWGEQFHYFVLSVFHCHNNWGAVLAFSQRISALFILVDTFTIMKWFFISSNTIALSITVAGFKTATPFFLWLTFKWYIFFHPFPSISHHSFQFQNFIGFFFYGLRFLLKSSTFLPLSWTY